MRIKVETLIEAERGCGYRKPGPTGVGIYLMGEFDGEPCERLPWPLTVCPCCGAGIKPTRGWTAIEPQALLTNSINPCSFYLNRDWHEAQIDTHQHTLCPVCTPPAGKHGLLWIGGSFYSPAAFLREASTLGVSRKLSTVPNDLVIGETIVYLAHREAITEPATFGIEPTVTPGIFTVFKPTHIDLVINSADDIPDRAKHIKERLGDKAQIVVIKKAEQQEEL